MGKVTNNTTKRHLNGSIVNMDTGEEYDNKKGAIYQDVKDDTKAINYQSYFYTDAVAVNSLINRGITQVELGLLFAISTGLKIDYNICMLDEETPHTTKSIAKKIGESPQSVKKKLNSLVEMNAIVYDEIYKIFSYGKVYLVNPHIIKKGRNIKPKLLEVFNPITY